MILIFLMTSPLALGLEFFVHSPFGKRLNEVEVIDRNTDSLVVQATFTVNGVATQVLLGSDLEHTAISDIVDVTTAKKRDERLESRTGPAAILDYDPEALI